MSHRSISVNDTMMTEDEFAEFIWAIESCEEYIGVFEIDWMCPLCFECVDKDGVLVHKDPAVYKCN